MTANETLTLDENGLPILTDRALETAPDEAPPEEPLLDSSPARSGDEIAEALLDSEMFHQQMDKIAAKLAVSIRQQIENAIRPAMGEAITQALNTSGDSVYALIGQQLENALPTVLAVALEQQENKEGP
ncbi:MAG: hypothetical protein PVJ15_09755 [Gammaproteobacteria bacterium]|jgi:hypothetical protein